MVEPPAPGPRPEGPAPLERADVMCGSDGVASAFVGRPVAEIRCLTNLNSVRTRSGGLRQPAMLTESLKTHTTKTRNSLSCAQISGGVARPGRSACAPNGTWRMSARSSGPGRSARHDSISSWQILTGLKVSYQLAQVDYQHTCDFSEPDTAVIHSCIHS